MRIEICINPDCRIPVETPNSFCCANCRHAHINDAARIAANLDRHTMECYQHQREMQERAEAAVLRLQSRGGGLS